VDGIVQSISPEDCLTDGGYWAAMLPESPPRRVLILGLGGGTLARLLRARGGDPLIVGVDDDVGMLELATRIGWLPQEGLEIVCGDAFEYVHSCRASFDFVAIDLFRGERLVGRVFGKPFLRRVRNLLEPHGRVTINLFSDRQLRDRLARLEVFFEILHRVGIGGNTVVHARRRA
jgi:spermidine synthase